MPGALPELEVLFIAVVTHQYGVLWCMARNRRRSKAASQDTIRTSVILSADAHAELERLAEKNDTSIAWVIRQAIKAYLDRDHPLYAASSSAPRRR